MRSPDEPRVFIMFLRLCQIVKQREFNLRTYKFTVMPYFPLGGVSVCLVNQFGKCATKQDPGLYFSEHSLGLGLIDAAQIKLGSRPRPPRRSMRIYLFVYIFSPLSICTLGDNIQSLNGKKREGSERAPILPSPHGQKIVCCTCDSACVLFCFSLASSVFLF